MKKRTALLSLAIFVLLGVVFFSMSELLDIVSLGPSANSVVSGTRWRHRWSSWHIKRTTKAWGRSWGGRDRRA